MWSKCCDARVNDYGLCVSCGEHSDDESAIDALTKQIELIKQTREARKNAILARGFQKLIDRLDKKTPTHASEIAMEQQEIDKKKYDDKEMRRYYERLLNH